MKYIIRIEWKSYKGDTMKSSEYLDIIMASMKPDPGIRPMIEFYGKMLLRENGVKEFVTVEYPNGQTFTTPKE